MHPPIRSAEQGFTLLEALVALAVLAVGLGAVGQVGFTTVAAARRTETHLFLALAAREAFAGLPEAVGEGDLSGKVGALAWRVRAAPLNVAAPGAAWVPMAVQLVVASPSGGTITIDTVQLKPAAGR